MKIVVSNELIKLIRENGFDGYSFKADKCIKQSKGLFSYHLNCAYHKPTKTYISVVNILDKVNEIINQGYYELESFSGVYLKDNSRFSYKYTLEELDSSKSFYEKTANMFSPFRFIDKKPLTNLENYVRKLVEGIENYELSVKGTDIKIQHSIHNTYWKFNDIFPRGLDLVLWRVVEELLPKTLDNTIENYQKEIELTCAYIKNNIEVTPIQKDNREEEEGEV